MTIEALKTMHQSTASDKHWNMKPNLGRAMMIAQRQLPEFVCDAVNLEGIPFTLPEIQTLLDGITVGGHKLKLQAARCQCVAQALHRDAQSIGDHG
jgi:hypothetical protein